MSEPITGKCNARLKGIRAGQLCTEDPMPGRARCRIHGGLSLRGADRPQTKAAAIPELSAPWSPTEKQLIREWRRDPEEGMRQTLAEVLVVQRRMLSAGRLEPYARLTTAAGTISRAIPSLHEVPPPDPTLPGIEFIRGDKREDFADDMTRQAASS